ncbi:MAG: hypothetical protein ACREIA_19550 [Opitutaceae bacterium]
MSKPTITFAVLVYMSLEASFAQTLVAPGGTLGNSGNAYVGIGVGSPGARLHLLDDTPTLLVERTSTTGELLLRSSSAPWEFTRLTNAGSVSKLSAGYSLHLLGDANASPTYGGGVFIESNNSMAEYAGTVTNKNLFTVRMDADGTPEDLFVVRGDSGHVGIGTSMPASSLHLQAAANPTLRIDEDQAAWNHLLLRVAAGGAAELLSGYQARIISDGNSSVTYSRGIILGSYASQAEYAGVGGPRSVLDVKMDLDGTPTTLLSVLGDTGNVGIGTATPSHKLAVNGTIKAREVIVETTGWPDYVFDDNYRLAPLNEVEAHINDVGHLPGVPSAEEVAEQGVSIGETQAKLLAKIEELTLHVIRQEKRLDEQEREIARLRCNQSGQRTAIRGQETKDR